MINTVHYLDYYLLVRIAMLGMAPCWYTIIVFQAGMTTHYHPVIGAKRVHYNSVKIYQELEKETGKVTFGSFGLSTKEPYYSHALSVVRPPASALASALASSVHTSPSYRIKHRSFIFGTNVQLYPSYMHVKYLIIVTCSF